MPKQKKTPSADDFSPEEMAQIQRHGEALGTEPTDFDEAVEAHLNEPRAHEINAEKMRAAQTGGSIGLGPSQMDQAAIQQQGALQKQATTQAAQQAQAAQAQQPSSEPPAAPSGPAGTDTPYPAQKGSVGGPGNVQSPAPASPPAAPGGPPPPDEGEEEGPPQ